MIPAPVWILLVVLNNVPTTIPFPERAACESAATSISKKFKKRYGGHLCLSQFG